MKEEDQIKALADWAGVGNEWLLMKRGLYYRPRAEGYTNSLSEAGRYSEAEADKHVYPHDEPVTKHPAPRPDYLHDYNELRRLEEKLNEDEKFGYDFEMKLIADARRVYPWELTLPERCRALLLEFGKWIV